jgi:hypothetical protein
VRVVEHMPLTANNKVNKQPLRTARWEASDAVWIRDPADGTYRRLTEADVDALRAEFEANGRGHILAVGG